MNSEPQEGNQFYHELHNVINRWREEGDRLTAFEIIGALEAVKADYMEALVKHNREFRRGKEE